MAGSAMIERNVSIFVFVMLHKCPDDARLLATKLRLKWNRSRSTSHTEKRKRYARLTPPNQSPKVLDALYKLAAKL